MSYLKSRKLERQLAAYKAVSGYVINIAHKKQKEYKSSIERLGMMIYNSGLSSTLAVLKSGNEPEKKVYEQIHNWIKVKQVIGFTLNPTDNDLLNNVLNINNSMALASLTIEVLAFSDALKEIVKAEI